MQKAADEAATGRPDWPRFRAGVSTGPVLLGNVGTREQRSFAAIGDTTNVAARLQAAASPGKVVVDSETAGALGDGAVLEDLGELRLKGRSEPVRAFVVTRLR
jgi:class 3 adenylate cyclase